MLLSSVICCEVLGSDMQSLFQPHLFWVFLYLQMAMDFLKDFRRLLTRINDHFGKTSIVNDLNKVNVPEVFVLMAIPIIETRAKTRHVKIITGIRDVDLRSYFDVNLGAPPRYVRWDID